MESPDTWDLLTSSLAACDLAHPHQAWAFLVVQNLVHDEPGMREQFVALVEQVLAEGPITGPSEPRRIAGRMGGLSREAANQRDPGGKIAAARKAAIDAWRQ